MVKTKKEEKIQPPKRINWFSLSAAIASTISYLFLFIAIVLLLVNLISIFMQGVPSYLPSKEATCFNNARATPINFSFSCQNPTRLNYLKIGNVLVCGLTIKSEKYDNASVKLYGYYTTPSGEVKYFIGNDTNRFSVELDKKSTNYVVGGLKEAGSYSVGFNIFYENETCMADLYDYFDVFSLSDVAQYDINAKIGLVLIITALISLISAIPSFMGYIEKLWKNVKS